MFPEGGDGSVCLFCIPNLCEVPVTQSIDKWVVLLPVCSMRHVLLFSLAAGVISPVPADTTDRNCWCGHSQLCCWRQQLDLGFGGQDAGICYHGNCSQLLVVVPDMSTSHRGWSKKLSFYLLCFSLYLARYIVVKVRHTFPGSLEAQCLCSGNWAVSEIVHAASSKCLWRKDIGPSLSFIPD